MRGLAKLTTIEAKVLFLRDAVVLLVALAVPIGVLLVFGLPGFAREPAAVLGGQRPIDTVLPSIALAISVAVLAISALPGYLAIYREKGILRRLSTTPASPAMLLVAQVAVNLAMLLVALGLVLAIGAVWLDMAMPLAQGLTGIITQLQAARHAEGRPADLARTSLTEARRTVRAVGPEPLDGAGLPDALADVVERWSSLHGVAAEVHTTGTVRQLHPEVEVALLRTAQEALANVAKHAAASRVGLTLSYLADLVTLDVRDDGVGFDPDAVQRDGDGGFGLTVMRQRVGRLAGTLLHVYTKLGVNDRAAAVAAAYERGLLTPGGS